MTARSLKPASTWKLQDAKARFSEVVRKAKSEGPQHVTVHGRDEAVIVSADEYARLRGVEGIEQETGLAILEAFRDPRFAGFSFERESAYSPVRPSPDFNDMEPKR